MTIVGAWVGVAVMAIGLVGLAGTVYGYRTEVIELRKSNDGLIRKVALLEGRLNQLDNRVLDNERTADTGPISLLDRPSPAQIASPTRPDLEAQKPPVQRTGATAINPESYGKHARTAA